MTIVRAHIEWLVDADHPENNIVNVPHFDVAGLFPGDDPSWMTLAGDIANGVTDWQKASAVAHKVRVKVYDAQAAKPNYPKAVYETSEAQHDLANWPHELALCLSYYSVHNVQRHRGRLYLCPGLCFTSQGLDTYATDTMTAKMGDLADVLADIGGVNVDWVVWSRRDNVAYPVTDWWVDNEWDVQRRRGLKATKRITGTTSEAVAVRQRYAEEHGVGYRPPARAAAGE